VPNRYLGTTQALFQHLPITSTDIDHLADTTPSIENILQSAQQRHLNRITEETAQQALADIQKTLSK